MLGSSPVSLQFDDNVLRLSKQITDLFNPLSKVLQDAHTDEKYPFPSADDQFESLLNIVSAAAQLSIQIRRSRPIFYFSPERPGNPYNQDDQRVIDYPAYAASKAAVVDGLHKDAKRVREAELYPGLGNTRNDGKQDLGAKRYLALVKFALWPSIQQYSPGNGKEGGERKAS